MQEKAAENQIDCNLKFNFESIAIDLIDLYFEGHAMVMKCNGSEEKCENGYHLYNLSDFW